MIGVADKPSILSALIAKDLGLLGPEPESLYHAQHKALFMKHMLSVDPQFPQTHIITPKQQSFDQFVYPVFIKPSRGSLSTGAYEVATAAQLKKILPNLFSSPHQNVLWFDLFASSYKNLDDPPLYSYIVQENISARQYTVDGLVSNKRISFAGITESIFLPNTRSFDRFDFPSVITRKAYDRKNKHSED